MNEKGCGKRVPFKDGSYMYNCGHKNFELCNECQEEEKQDEMS